MPPNYLRIHIRENRKQGHTGGSYGFSRCPLLIHCPMCCTYVHVAVVSAKSLQKNRGVWPSRRSVAIQTQTSSNENTV